MSASAAIRHLDVVRPRTAGREPSPAAPRPLTPVPRTSLSQPWDRVRFAGPNSDPADGRVPLSPEPEAGPASAGPVPTEDPTAWCGSLVRAAVEALLGIRPTAQLARWLTADLYEVLARRAGLAVRINGRPTTTRNVVVRRVHLCPVSPYAAEASVVVHDGERVRAAAIRIDAHRGRWRATALQIG